MTNPNTIDFFREHLKTSGGVESFIKHIMQMGQQCVHTPFDLCLDMLGKLNEYTALTDKKIGVLFNIEFLHTLINAFGVNPENICMFADDDVEYEFCRLQYGMKPGFNLYKIDIVKTVETNILHTNKGKFEMKFDVIVMNPPYQASVKKNKSDADYTASCGHTIWDKFVEVSFQLAKEDGHICAVHPARWRKPDDKLGSLMRTKEFLFLQIFNKQQGLMIFGATTRADWYVLRNRNPVNDYELNIVGEDAKQITIPISYFSKLPFIPNFDFDFLTHVLAEDGQERCDIIYNSSSYHTQKNWISSGKNDNFKYPCVSNTGQGGVRHYWSSVNDKGLFGVPKVIFGDSDTIGNAVVDIAGNFAMTQHAYGIPITSNYF